MRISDWSSDVCSSDLYSGDRIQVCQAGCLSIRSCADSVGKGSKTSARSDLAQKKSTSRGASAATSASRSLSSGLKSRVEKAQKDRKSVVEGKSVSVRVDLGGRRLLQKTKKHQN